MMNELDRYLGATYINSCQPAIATKTPATLPNPEMPKIIPYTGDKSPKTDADITYLEKKNIGEAIYQKLSNKDVYETKIHKILYLIVGKTNEKLQEKAVLDATFQEVKKVRDPIG